MTYRHAPCHHCGTRSAAERCRDCDQDLCEPCAVDGRCPTCWRAKLGVAAQRRRRWLTRMLPATLALTIVGVLWNAVGVCRYPGASLLTHARTQLRVVQQALALYALDHDDCPEVLGALYSRNYVIQQVLTDPWGEPLDYQCLRRKGGRGILLSSAGPDRQTGTLDDIRLDHEIRW